MKNRLKLIIARTIQTLWKWWIDWSGSGSGAWARCRVLPLSLCRASLDTRTTQECRNSGILSRTHHGARGATSGSRYNIVGRKQVTLLFSDQLFLYGLLDQLSHMSRQRAEGAFSH